MLKCVKSIWYDIQKSETWRIPGRKFHLLGIAWTVIQWNGTWKSVGVLKRRENKDPQEAQHCIGSFEECKRDGLPSY